MHDYLFTLGHQPHISTAELYAVFSTLGISYTSEKNHTALLIHTKKELPVEKLMGTLGGTVSIAKKITGSIEEHILASQPEGKIQFSVADKKQGLTIKKELKAKGRSVRYIEAKNTATILHNDLVRRQGNYIMREDGIFVTVAIQPLEKFAKRDFGRPGSDDLSGMLPPKLARIMINLSQADQKKILLDPFCGSGTVLMEAATLGFSHIIGSDISEKAIADTKKNMTWLSQESKLEMSDVQLFESDARKLDVHVKKGSVDVIVAEPYLGKPLKGNESEKTLRDQAQELATLYTESFATLHSILKKNGVLVCVIPQFRHGQDWIMIDCIDAIKKIGFEPTALLNSDTSLLYHRPKQHVGRALWRFQKR